MMDGELECRVPLVESPRISLRVVRHSLHNGNVVNCRSFLTEGLWQLEHRDILFTFKLTDKQMMEESAKEPGTGFDSAADTPAGLFQLLEGIINYAAKGDVASAGSTTRLDPKRGSGLFGNDKLRAILYIPCALDGFPTDVLQALALTWDELEAVQEVGPVRTMAALGEVNRFFPSTIWIDTERTSLVTSREWVETSQLHTLGLPVCHTPAPSAFVYLATTMSNPTTTDQNNVSGMPDTHGDCGKNHVVLEYNDVLRGVLRAERDTLLARKTVGLFTFPTNEAKQIMTHPIDPSKRNEGSITTISHGIVKEDNATLKLLGNFFVLMELDDESKLGGTQVEDGFVIFVKSLVAVIDSIVEGKDMTLGETGMGWPVEVVYRQEHDGFFKDSREEIGVEKSSTKSGKQSGIELELLLMQVDERALQPDNVNELAEAVGKLQKAVEGLQMFSSPCKEGDRVTEDVFSEAAVRLAFEPKAAISMVIEMEPGKEPHIRAQIRDTIEPMDERKAMQGKVLSAVFNQEGGPNSLGAAADAALGALAPKVKALFLFRVCFFVTPSVLFGDKAG